MSGWKLNGDFAVFEFQDGSERITVTRDTYDRMSERIQEIDYSTQRYHEYRDSFQQA